MPDSRATTDKLGVVNHLGPEPFKPDGLEIIMPAEFETATAE